MGIEAPDRPAARLHRQIRHILGCAVVPLVVILLALSVKTAIGPYWLGSNFDPEYCYLLNGLNILEGVSPSHIDHPGTSVQETVALVIKIRHMLAGRDDVMTDVLRCPEAYLASVNTTVIVWYGMVLWALGFAALRVMGSWTPALLLQLSPLLARRSLYALGHVDPEPMLLTLTGLLSIVLIFKLRESSPRRDALLGVLVGGIIGAILATKITALPFVVMPVLLFAGWRRKFVSLVAMVLAFLVVTVPIWARFRQFYDWIVGLITHTGEYGSGEAGLMIWSKIPSRAVDLVIAEPVYAFVVMVTGRRTETIYRIIPIPLTTFPSGREISQILLESGVHQEASQKR